MTPRLVQRVFPGVPEGARDAIWLAMRVPVFAFVALLLFLAGIVGLGTLVPGRTASFLEAGLTLCSVGTVLLFTMEVRHEAPILRFYAVLGFMWLAILVGMTMLDFVTR